MGYLLGTGLVLLGVTSASIAVGTALRSARQGLHRFMVPGDAELRLRAGVHMAFSQPKEDEGPAGVDWSGLRVSLESVSSGEIVPAERVPGAVMSLGGRRGTVLFRCQAPEDGSYRLRTELPGGGAPAECFLAHESLSGNRSDVAVGVLLLLVFGGFGGYVLFRTWKAGQLSK